MVGARAVADVGAELLPVLPAVIRLSEQGLQALFFGLLADKLVQELKILVP